MTSAPPSSNTRAPPSDGERVRSYDSNEKRRAGWITAPQSEGALVVVRIL